MKTLYFAFAFLCAIPFAQAQKISEFVGKWTGVLTQQEGGYRQQYYCELTVEQKGDQLFGITYVSVEEVSAEMAFTAQEKGKTLIFKENRIVRYTQLENMAWCLKWGDLQVRKKGNLWFLEGKWNGQSVYGPCIPGKVQLQRQVPRA
jgi:hypothetical protein